MLKTVDLQPHLTGDLLELRPLRAEDWEALFAAASDPLIWELHPSSDRYKEDVFREFFADALASKGALVAVDRKTRRIIGCSRYCLHGSGQGELQIGWTFLVRSHWGGKHNGEMKWLMLHHAFTFVDSVIFRVGAANLRSRKAVEKIGGVLVSGEVGEDPSGNPADKVTYRISKPQTGTTV